MMRVPRRRLLLAAAAAFAVLSGSCGEPRATTPSDHPTSSSALLTTSSPQLLECPTTQSLSTLGIVGPLGGTLSIGAASITIPPGALSLPTLFDVTVPASPYMEIDITANRLRSFLFNSPVSVTIDYSRCDPAATAGLTLSVWHIDVASKALLENMGGVNDTTARRITFSTPHLSGYAIAF
jgi:hypothetical protein